MVFCNYFVRSNVAYTTPLIAYWHACRRMFGEVL